MKKKINFIKKVFMIFLIILLDVNSFAAVVSDNDGSAFITKAEFDSLKNNFQASLDTYNSSIDSKIDMSIAAYLSGVKLNEKETKTVLSAGIKKEISYFDNANFVYKYGRPALNITSESVQWQTNRRTLSADETQSYYQKVVMNTSGAKSSSTLVDVLDYTISSNNLTINKCKLAGYSNDIETSITLLADHGMCNSGWGPGWDAFTARFCFGQNSWATDKSTFQLNFPLKNYLYQHSNMDIGHENSVSDNCTVNFGMANISTGNVTGMYNIAYNGSTNVFVCNNSPTPFNMLGYNDFKTYASTETEKNMMSDTSTSVAGTISYMAYDASIGYTAIINGTKSTGRDDTYMGILYGLGLMRGHNILQNISDFSDSRLGITVNDITLAAGLPLLIDERGRHIEWCPVFADNTKTYRVWLSYEPFDHITSSGVPGAINLDYVDINEKVPGQKYAEITGGTGKLTWDMARNSIVYMKWAEIGGTQAAAGTLKLASCNTYDCS